MPAYKDTARGTWYVKYSAKDPLTGKRKQILKRGFETKRDAVKWEARQKASGETSSGSITFAQLAEQYYAYNSPKERTQRTQTDMMEKYFTGYDMPLGRLTKAYMTDWYISFSKTDLKPSTRNLLIKIIRSIFRFGADHYGFQNSAAMLKTYKEPKRQYTTWNLDEFRQFISAVDNPFYHALFSFYYFTGCRMSEATGLIRSDFDLEAGTVHIQRNLKTEASDRVLKLPQPLVDELKPLLDLAEDGQVFPVAQTTLFATFRRYTDKAGVPRIRIHDLRHSFATNAIGHGANIVAVSRYLGHSTINQTLKTYSHLLEESHDDLVSNIESWMK